MSETPPASQGSATRWVSPFCLLLCDTLSVRADAATGGLELVEGQCEAARRALTRFKAAPSAATPQVHGVSSSLDEALGAAARILAASRQPLIGGLGTDVAGARAVHRLARETGAICDPAGGAALMHTLRTLQDRGGYGTTLAEVRNRADLIVCLGGMPSGDAAELLARCGVGEAGTQQRHLVLLGGAPADQASLAALAGRAGLSTEAVALQGDLFGTVAILSALVAGRPVTRAAPELAKLAERLLAARYGVLVGQSALLPAHGNLVVEMTHRIVATLNQRTRAAALWLGGGNGAGTVNEVFTWLGGLPVRTRLGAVGSEHDPLCFEANRLLADAAVDCLVWISSFDPDCAPPATPLPLIVLGHPELASSAMRQGSVFVPVSTPGIGSAGHLFRADGGAVLPLVPLHDDKLPTLPEVLGGLVQRVQGLRAKASP